MIYLCTLFSKVNNPVNIFDHVVHEPSVIHRNTYSLQKRNNNLVVKTIMLSSPQLQILGFKVVLCFEIR